MNFRETYKRKLASSEQAVLMVKNHTEAWVGVAVGMPVALINALVERNDEVKDITINGLVDLYPQIAWKGLGRESNIQIECGYATQSRGEVISGQFTMNPTAFHQLPRLHTDDNMRPMHAAMIMVTPMDQHGYFCLGLGADTTVPIARNAAMKRSQGDDRFLVLAQVNNHVPRSRGNNFIHISEIDAIVEQDQVLATLPEQGEPSPEEKMIGKYCADFVKDGCTLQLGIGGIPNAAARAIFDTNVRDLGIHSEMACDTMKELWEAGIVNNRRKTLMSHRSIFTFAMGSQKLYEWIDNNPGVEFYPVDFVNDPHIIGKNEKMLSINACLEVDLTGQICSESVGWKQYTHPGGQLDFVYGSFLSRDGVSIIATESTATPGGSGGKRISKIVPNIAQGGIVTTPRSCADYVITEYGTAKIRGQSMRQRVKNLIAIAHPDYRDELEFVARQRQLI